MPDKDLYPMFVLFFQALLSRNPLNSPTYKKLNDDKEAEVLFVYCRTKNLAVRNYRRWGCVLFIILSCASFILHVPAALSEPIIVWGDAAEGELCSYQIGESVQILDSSMAFLGNLATDACNIYWTDSINGTIVRKDVDPESSPFVLRPETEALNLPVYDLAADSSATNPEDRLFWSGGRYGGIAVKKGLLAFDDFQDFSIVDFSDGLKAPRALAVDQGNSKVYWVDSGAQRYNVGESNKIQRAGLDGTVIEDLVTSIGSVHDLAIDLTGNKIYWADNSVDGSSVLEPRIRRANLDGSSLEDIVSSGLVYVSRLAVDSAAGKIYWIDLGEGKLQRANLDGSSKEDLRSDIEYGMGLGLLNVDCSYTATPTPTGTATPTSTATPTFTETPTSTRTATGTATSTSTATSAYTETPTGTHTATPTPTCTESPTPSATPTITPSITPSVTPTRTSVPIRGGGTIAGVVEQINKIVKGAPLNAEVEGSGDSHTVTFVVPRFTDISVKAAVSKLNASASVHGAVIERRRLLPYYEIRLERLPTSKKNDIQQKISKRDSTTFSKLRSGKFRARYRVELRQIKGRIAKTIARSRYSRWITFSVLP